MGKIRILVVDDSVVMRRVLTRVLSSDPGLEVVGSAPNGRIALAKIPEVNPDLVTLDIEMPEMDGVQALAAIRKTHPRLPVIIFSALSEHSAAAAFEMLALGAYDVVTKRQNVVETAAAATQRIRDELIPKIKMYCSAAGDIRPCAAGIRVLPVKSSAVVARTAAGREHARADALAIGVSTGGPNALAEVLGSFPSDFPVPVLIVQHMPKEFTKLLAERLNAICALRVTEGVATQVLQPGHAWVAPGDFHMIVENRNGEVCIQTHQGPPENSCRPSVDVLFRSVAEVFGPHALAVVLTGMGQDGLRGSERIREAGGRILVQDEESSVVWGMPGFVANAGLADKVLPVRALGSEIVRMVWEGRPVRPVPRPRQSWVKG